MVFSSSLKNDEVFAIRVDTVDRNDDGEKRDGDEFPSAILLSIGKKFSKQVVNDHLVTYLSVFISLVAMPAALAAGRRGF